MADLFSERVQTLLSADQLRRLQLIAEARDSTVSAMVREAVEEYHLRPQDESRRERALATIFSIEVPAGTWEEIESEIERGQSEGGDELGPEARHGRRRAKNDS